MSRFAVFLLVILVFTSCAPAKSIQPERITEIRKIGLVTKVADNDLIVFDRTRTMNRTYGGTQFGAVGGLIEGLILTGMAAHAMNKSLQGDPDDIKQYLKDINFKSMVDNRISGRLSRKYDLVLPQYFDTRAHDNPSKFATDSNYLKEAMSLGIDTLIFIEYYYGLGAFKDRPACVVVAGKITVYDVKSETIIFDRLIASDDDFVPGYRTVDEFVNDNAKLFKEDLNTAVDGFSYLVATQLGITERY
ncbi:MAG: hypothetical protein EPN25_14330 [Nitrospirae bacterium]|nr:MAG: hypothetical protein EPN25_14330 [Nitrospirota bacterium]